LTGIPRLRLRDDWTTHHDNAIFATLRSRLEDDNSADRADSIGHLVRPSITTGRGLAALTAGDFREARESLVRLGRRKRNLDVAWRHLRQLGLLKQPRHLTDRRPLRTVLIADLGDHPHRALTQLRRIPPRRTT
jgi:hypothetical protein